MDQVEYQKYVDKVNTNVKLMNKSLRMIISFFASFIIGVILLMVLQGNKFFIFNFRRTFNNVPSPLVAELFSVIFSVIVILAFVSYILFTLKYIRRKPLNINQQLKDLQGFKRLFSLADIFSIVPIFLVIVMVINGFFFSFAQVDGISMQPTFCDHDAVIIKYVQEYQIDDIVILEQDDIYLIKRLVGKPGDTLVVNASGVYINDALIEDSVGNRYISYDIVIPEGYYYVMGDNRNHSEDSRFFGLKAEESMLGKVLYRISTSTCEIE